MDFVVQPEVKPRSRKHLIRGIPTVTILSFIQRLSIQDSIGSSPFLFLTVGCDLGGIQLLFLAGRSLVCQVIGCCSRKRCSKLELYSNCRLGSNACNNVDLASDSILNLSPKKRYSSFVRLPYYFVYSIFLTNPRLPQNYA